MEDNAASPPARAVIDARTLGLELAGKRTSKGFKPALLLTDLLREKYGVSVHPRTIYAIERGEQLPRLDLLLAIMMALDIDLRALYPAFRDDVVEHLRTLADRP